MPYAYSPSVYTDEQEIFRSSYRKFLETEADAHVDEWLEKDAIPKAFWRKAGEQGFLAIGIPEEYGGPGGDFVYRLIMAQELGYSIAGASIAPAVIADGVSEICFHSAPEEMRKRLMPKVATGELRLGFAVTEPDTGSDMGSIRTSARREGDEWVINGAKTYIGSAATADVFMVACKTSPDLGIRGITVFLVEADRPGFKRGRKLKKMGTHLSGTGELSFSDVRIPASNMIGPENGGAKVMMYGFNTDRLIWPCIAHGAAQRAFDETVNFTRNRKAFGQPIIDFQNTRFKLAEMKTELSVGRAFLENEVREYRRTSQLDPTRCAMAKMWLTEMEGRIIDQCVQLHGGAGYMEEYPVSRLYTAARLHRIFAGTAEILRLLIGRSI